MDPTTNPIYLIFAGLVPVLIMLVKQAKFPNNVNALIAFAVYIAVGIVAAISTAGTPTLETIVPFIAVVTVVGSAAYQLFWSQLQVGGTSIDNAVTAGTSIT